ncbi:MAG: hypothetical protein COV52_01445 [Gammaproteobacteria bacterium CG11_big_fil_rev_8_21_14_0_20_46_22]|nr:MAG: hypothetical protein COW05_03170 [Gammaproteobacteria bacterium CG12_big_fil_rev_8_21_14_0_65_46_12]PIR11919.1 MAG: hypothetical protein COV52_01445 [Gammaproteobacteria bacterium CG11_big_fil_rev_8_21_14_0_20_46_22]
MLKKLSAILLTSGCLLVPALQAKTSYLFTQIGQQVTVKPCARKHCDYTILMTGLTRDEVTYFSDRPKHFTGAITIEKFMANWSKGEDSFAKDHPNASFVYFDNRNQITQDVVRLSQPKFDKVNHSLQYNVKMIGKGRIQPGTYQHPVLFIDPGWNPNAF